MGSTLLARIPRALPAPAARLPEFWGAPRIPASIKTAAGNSGRQRRRVSKDVGLGQLFQTRQAPRPGFPAVVSMVAGIPGTGGAAKKCKQGWVHPGA